MHKQKLQIKQFFLKHYLAIISASVLVMQLFSPFLIGTASAATMTYTLVRLDRMAANGENSTGTVCAKPATTTAASGVTVKVTFPSSSNFTVNTTAANWTVSTTSTGWPKDPADNTTTATAWPGIGTATAVSSQSVTFPSNQLTAGTWYCFNWTGSSTLTVVATAGASDLIGTVITQNTGPATVDTGTYATATLGSSSNGDQIAVTATVTQTFNFSLSANTAALGTLSTSGPTASSAINARVDTNAANGWNMWAKDDATTCNVAATCGLKSTTASHYIVYSPTVGSTASALSNGVEGYNLGLGTTSQTSGSGTITKDANFDSGGTSFKGGGLDNIHRILAYSTGTANNAVVPLTINAEISGITPAASDYADTIDVVAAGRF